MYLAFDKQLIGQIQPSCLTLAPTYILHLIGKGRGGRTARDDQNVSLHFLQPVSLELTAVPPSVIARTRSCSSFPLYRN